jgi:multimeric flavodoxin WrbA
MMKDCSQEVTILNGMRESGSPTERVHTTLVNTLTRRNWNITAFTLKDAEIRPCLGCFGCWIQKPGQCVLPDSHDIAASVVQSGLVIFLTPVTFGGYSSELKKAVDHLIPNILPFFTQVDGETHHKPRYKQYAKLLFIGVAPERDTASEAIFTKLAERNAINMWAPAWHADVLTHAQIANGLETTIGTWLDALEVHA